MLSDLQKRKISRLFQVFDGNGDGYIEPSDAERVAKRIASIRGWSEDGERYEQLEQLYREGIDAIGPFLDDQGRADLDAYIRFHDQILNVPGLYQQAVGQLADFIFQVLDADGDGKISLEEVRQFYQAYAMDEDLAPKAFEKLDVDGDGFLSQSEIKDAVAQFYLSSDPDARGNWLLGTF